MTLWYLALTSLAFRPLQSSNSVLHEKGLKLPLEQTFPNLD